MRSLDLRTEPSIRQTETILRRIDEELTARGARVERAGSVGGLRFRMPWPWNAPRLGILLAISSGRAVVSAGSGGPWRVRYSLDFSILRGLVGLLSVALVVFGLAWPGQLGLTNRLDLLNALALLWLVLYGIPYAAASARFRRIIQASAADVVERRHGRRPETLPASNPADSNPDPDSDPPVDDIGVRPIE